MNGPNRSKNPGRRSRHHVGATQNADRQCDEAPTTACQRKAAAIFNTGFEEMHVIDSIKKITPGCPVLSPGFERQDPGSPGFWRKRSNTADGIYGYPGVL